MNFFNKMKTPTELFPHTITKELQYLAFNLIIWFNQEQRPKTYTFRPGKHHKHKVESVEQQ